MVYLEDNMKSQVSEREPEVPIDSENYFFVDGTQGYLSKEKNFSLFECYKRPRTEIMNLYSRFVLDSNYDLKELTQQFNGAIGIGIDISKDSKIGGKEVSPISINVGLNFNFENFFSESKLSSNLYYYAVIIRRRTFNYNISFNNSLSEDGFKTLKKSGIKKFYEDCGDALVDRVIEGGLIIVKVEIRFKSEEDQKKFGLKANLGLGNFLELGANINDAVTNLKVDGEVNLRAIQLGGESSQFSRIFPSGNTAACMGIVNKNVQDSKKQISECHKFLYEVSTYIRQDFPKQFSDYRKGVFHAFNTTTMDAAKYFGLS